MASAGVWQWRCESIWQPPLGSQEVGPPGLLPPGTPSTPPSPPRETFGAVPLLQDPPWLRSSCHIPRVLEPAPGQEVWGLLPAPGAGRVRASLHVEMGCWGLQGVLGAAMARGASLSQQG